MIKGDEQRNCGKRLIQKTRERKLQLKKEKQDQEKSKRHETGESVTGLGEVRDETGEGERWKLIIP